MQILIYIASAFNTFKIENGMLRDEHALTVLYLRVRYTKYLE